MAFSTHEFKLDLTPGASRPVLYASQGDIGRPFMARCYWNGATWNADAYTVNIRGRKPDETVFDYTATADSSTVTFETTEQMTIVSGPVECELVFSNDGDVIASANFVLIVEESPYNPDAPSQSVIPGINELVENAVDDVIGTDVRDETRAWIEEHPEDITTVQDGAISFQKLDASLKNTANTVNVNSTRIDDLVANAGDTDGNAELLDIRTAYNDAQYKTAGGAVRGQFTDLVDGVFTVDNIIQGSYNAAGAVVTNSARIRTKGFIPVSKYDVVNFARGTNTAQIFLGYYNENKVFIGDGTWHTDGNIEISWDGFIIAVFKNDNNNAITPEQFDAAVSITRIHSFDAVASDMDLYAGNVQKYIPPRNCINIYIENDACKLEEGTGSVYLHVAGQFIVRAGIDGQESGTAYAHYATGIYVEPSGTRMTYAESLGTPLVTSPGGLPNCIEIAPWKCLVWNMSTKLLKVVSRVAIKKDDVPLITNRNGVVSYLHPYFQKIYAEQKAAEAATLSENDEVLTALKNARAIPYDRAIPLTIAHFSDLHGDTTALGRITNDINALSDYIDDVICTGDMVTEINAVITTWWNPNYMTVIGNHDAATGSSGNYNWNALTMAEKVEKYIAPFESNWNITRESGKSYYYKDYATQNVRLIVLDGQLYYNGGTTDGTAQTAWFADLLADAITDELHVLVAIHAPVNNAPVVDCNFSRYGRTNMVSLSDSFTPTEIVNAVSTAIGNGLNFVGYIVGHNHQDYIYRPAAGQIGFCVTCAKVNNKPSWYESDQYRDTTLDAFNLVTIDTYNKLVKIVRGGGANIDNLTRPREGITFNYNTGEIVGEIK